ncbi:MAG: hypothetical protein LBH58_09000 [Tannerellaceae bacterium]|jgi:hypothetical protein|nr:hypothetical protein [Tannerellaceae bacterium]
MIFFAKDKNHMSGFVVIMFYILILADIGMGASSFQPDHEFTGWLNTTLGISSFVSAIGLIILLNGYKIGGYIALIGIGLQFTSAALMPETRFGDDKWEVLIGYSLVHVISVFLVLFGSRNHYLK